MSEQKFTSFKVKRESKPYLPPQFLIMDEAESKQIAVVFDPKYVNLIAAAPELYAEMKEFRDEMHRLFPYVKDLEWMKRIDNLLSKIETP